MGDSAVPTAAERRLLDLVADGASNREIAKAMHLSEGFTAHCVSRAMRRLGARNRAHLVRLGVEAGWIVVAVAAVVNDLPG